MPLTCGVRRAELPHSANLSPVNFNGAALTYAIPIPIPATGTWYVTFTYTHTSGAFVAGLYAAATAAGNPIVGINPANNEFKLQIGASTVEAYSLTAGSVYQVVIDYDGTYVRWSIKGGSQYAAWTEIYRSSVISLGATLYLAFKSTTAIASIYNIAFNSGAYPYSTTPTRFVTLRFSSVASFTFDPSITTSAGTATWVLGDGTSYTTNSLSQSKSGDQLCKITGIAASVVLTLDANTDNLAGDWANLYFAGMVNLTSILTYTNSSLAGSLSQLSANTALTTITLAGSPLLTGSLANLALLVNLTSINLAAMSLITGVLSSVSGWAAIISANLAGLTLITGNISSLSTWINATTVSLASNSNITGDLSGITTCIKLQVLYLYGTAVNGTAGLGSIPTLRDVRVYSCSWTQAECDATLLDLWNNRMSFTYASTINLDMKAGNATPSGTFQIPGDCNNPTALEAAYELENDSCLDGHKLWDTDYP